MYTEGSFWSLFNKSQLNPVHTPPLYYVSKGTVKAVPLQAWSGPEDSRKLRFPGYMTTAQDGGKVVNLMHRPPLPPRKYNWYSFLLGAESTPGPYCDRKDYVNENVQ
jgi:hypothetical protein